MQDCVIIGGGPGGLAAALYLVRFRQSCVVLDSGRGRASMIPRCRNFPGFPGGIPGSELLVRMREQLGCYGIQPINIEALALEESSAGFLVKTAGGEFAGRTVLLATGMLDVRAPFQTDSEHDEALQNGLLHYCPVCDGYEVSGKRVVVFGSGPHGAKEALFLRSFTTRVELVCPSGTHTLSNEDRKKLRSANVAVVDGPIVSLRLETGAIRYAIADRAFAPEALYVAMGCSQRSSLAMMAGARLSQQGCVAVDAHQQTTVKRLYAVGDVVAGLDQIVTAIGQAAIAATAIRSELQSAGGG